MPFPWKQPTDICMECSLQFFLVEVALSIGWVARIIAREYSYPSPELILAFHRSWASLSEDLWHGTAWINVSFLPDHARRVLELQKMLKSDLKGTWGSICCICRSLGTDYRRCPWQHCNYQTSSSSWSHSIFWCGCILHPVQWAWLQA